MPLTSKGKRRLLDALVGNTPAFGAGTWISIHTGIPDETGSNEATGGSPAYARQQATWFAAAQAANGKDAYIDQLSIAAPFDLPAGTYYFAGLWSASSGGDFLGWCPLNGGGGDTMGLYYNASSAGAWIPYAGAAINDAVILRAPVGAALPTPFVEASIYYIRGTSTTLNLSATSGGSNISSTTTGQMYIQRLIPTVYAVQSKLVINALQWKLED